MKQILIPLMLLTGCSMLQELPGEHWGKRGSISIDVYNMTELAEAPTRTCEDAIWQILSSDLDGGRMYGAYCIREDGSELEYRNPPSYLTRKCTSRYYPGVLDECFIHVKGTPQ
jgi:hypothetical protein